LPLGASEEGLDADEEDVEVEGLWEIVVGTGFEAGEDVLGMVKPSAPGNMQSRTMAAIFSGGARR
jgi:hypothetical protein